MLPQRQPHSSTDLSPLCWAVLSPTGRSPSDCGYELLRNCGWSDSAVHMGKSQSCGRCGTARSCTLDDVPGCATRHIHVQTGIYRRTYTSHSPHMAGRALSCSAMSVRSRYGPVFDVVRLMWSSRRCSCVSEARVHCQRCYHRQSRHSWCLSSLEMSENPSF